MSNRNPEALGKFLAEMAHLWSAISGPMCRAFHPYEHWTWQEWENLPLMDPPTSRVASAEGSADVLVGDEEDLDVFVQDEFFADFDDLDEDFSHLEDFDEDFFDSEDGEYVLIRKMENMDSDSW